jgi:hypothetical protein
MTRTFVCTLGLRSMAAGALADSEMCGALGLACMSVPAVDFCLPCLAVEGDGQWATMLYQ